MTRRRPLFKPSDVRGVLQLAPRYLLVLAIVAGIAGYFIGLAAAPTIHPNHDLPSWFQPYFICVAGVIGTVVAALLQVNFTALELSPRNAAVVYLWLTLGLLAAIAGATTAPSRGWYAQLLAFSDLGVATAVVALIVCVGLKKLSTDARDTKRAWHKALRGRKPPA